MGNKERDKKQGLGKVAPSDYDFRESLLPPEKQRRLNELRRIQSGREFTPDELKDFKQLSEESQSEESSQELTPEERQEYTRLSKKSTGEGFSNDEERALFVRLQRKADEANQKRQEGGY